MVEVGSNVIVVNPGSIYTTYLTFFKRNGFEEWEQYYREHRYPRRSATFKVVGKAIHHQDKRTMMYILHDEELKQVFLYDNEYDSLEIVVDKVSPDEFFKEIGISE